MGFAEETARAMAVWFGPGLTDAVTYNGLPLRGHVQYAAEGGRPGGVMLAATLQVRAADVPAPAYRDAVVINGLTWHVQNGWTGDNLTWTLPLARDERPVWRP
jgi:hypothetical protein